MRKPRTVCPLCVSPDAILDGRNRALAREKAGVAPRTVVYDGNDPIGCDLQARLGAFAAALDE